MESRIIAFSQAGADAARACGEGSAARFEQGADAGRPALGWAGGAAAPRGATVELTKAGAKVRTFVIPTNEEYMIARDTLALSK